jgi:hypothetical protein
VDHSGLISYLETSSVHPQKDVLAQRDTTTLANDG